MVDVKEKYVRNKFDGTYSPLSKDGKTVIVGLVLTSLPKNGECVGEFEY